MGSNAILVLLLVGLFAGAVFFAAAETSLVRVRPTAVQVEARGGDPRARRVLRLLADLPVVMNTVLLGALLAQIGAATVTGMIASDAFGNLGVTIASVLLTVALFVYAESIPKTFAVRHPLAVAKAVSWALAALTWILRPAVRLLVAFADVQSPGRGIVTRHGVTEDELRALAAESVQAGEITERDFELMERAFEFGDETVERVFVPRIDVFAVPATATARAALEEAVAGGYRRVPVYEDTIEDITGVVLLRDLARAVTEGRAANAGDLARPVLVVPETTRINDVLQRMQDAGTHFAVVIDEHGGMAGIATIEDLVEALLGEFVADEGEPRRTRIRPVGEGRWMVDGRTSVRALGDRIGATFPEGDWRTVAGLVLAEAGHIPATGDVFDITGYRFEIKAATARGVRTVEIAQPQLPPEAKGR